MLGSTYDTTLVPVITKLANLSDIQLTKDKPEGALSFITQEAEYYLLLGDLADHAGELVKLNEELKYTKGFLQSVLKKLSNERFVQNAPEQVVAIEKKKQEDAENKIKALEERIKELAGSSK